MYNLIDIWLNWSADFSYKYNTYAFVISDSLHGIADKNLALVNLTAEELGQLLGGN